MSIPNNYGNNSDLVLGNQISIQKLFLKFFHSDERYNKIVTHKLTTKENSSGYPFSSFNVQIMDINGARREYQKHVYFQLFLIFLLLLIFLFQFSMPSLSIVIIVLFPMIFMYWLFISIKSEKYKREEEIQYISNGYVLTEYKKPNTFLDKYNLLIEPFYKFYVTVEIEDVNNNTKKYLYVASYLAYHNLLKNLKLRYDFTHIHSS